MIIYLKEKYNTKEQAARFAEKIKEKNLAYFASSIRLDLANFEIRIGLKKDLSKEVVDEIASVLAKKYREFEVRATKTAIILRLSSKSTADFKKLQKVKRRILYTPVAGVKGIKNVIVRRELNRWVINTLGSNLAEILKMPEVDVRKTTTNNIVEVEKVLGIEAARNVIIREAINTLNQQGLDVDIRHIILVADTMTFSGKVKAVGRYGVAGAKKSVLARAAFEETVKHLTRAAIKGESEEFKGMFENVMIGQVVPAGTGMVELISTIARGAKRGKGD